MQYNASRWMGLSILAALAAGFCPAGLAAQAPAPDAAGKPVDKSLRGRLVSIDQAAGRMKISWKHPKQAYTMEIEVQLIPSAQVVLNGKPAAAGDLKPGDNLVLTGGAEGIGDANRFAVRKVEATRSAASAPASQPPASGGTPVDRILDRLERKGDQVRDIVTSIKFTKTDPVLQDTQVFSGILRFKDDKPNPRFLIRFDQFTQEGVTRAQKEWHVFDGQWYIEAREKTSTIVKRQIVRPGEQVNVFRLGQGPFPLPFGQKKAEIEKYFDVALKPAEPKDPPGSAHLECTPKPGTDMEKRYGKVHFFIDRELDLPVMVRTVEKSENVEITAEFPASSIRLNTGLAGSELNLPDLKGFQVDTIPLEGGEKPVAR